MGFLGVGRLGDELQHEQLCSLLYPLPEGRSPSSDAGTASDMHSPAGSQYLSSRFPSPSDHPTVVAVRVHVRNHSSMHPYVREVPYLQTRACMGKQNSTSPHLRNSAPYAAHLTGAESQLREIPESSAVSPRATRTRFLPLAALRPRRKSSYQSVLWGRNEGRAADAVADR